MSSAHAVLLPEPRALLPSLDKTGFSRGMCILNFIFRDLKMKKTRRSNEPKFCVADYVEQEKKETGCCS